MSSTRAIHFFRGNTEGFMWRLVVAAVAIGAGAAITLGGALSLQLGISHGWQIASACVGSGSLLVGLVVGFVSLPHTLTDESCLHVRMDGLLFDFGSGNSTLFLWDDLQRIEGRDDGLVLHLATGEERKIEKRFGDKTFAELARTLEQSRMRANLLILR